MAENLNREDIARLERAISKTDALTARQEEIIKKVLAGETEIANKRIGYLNEYFDTYSTKLDDVARKNSMLGDNFLILERQLAESFAAATKELDNATKAVNNRSSSGSSTPTTSPPPNGVSGNSGGGNPPPNGGSGNSGGGNPPPNGGNSNTIAPGQRDSLSYESEEQRKLFAEQMMLFFQKSEQKRREIITSENEYLDALEGQRLERRTEALKGHANQTEAISKKIMDIENARYQTVEDREIQLTEIKLNRLQESLEAELSAQELINKFSAEIDYAEGLDSLRPGNQGQVISEAGEVASRKSLAKDQAAYAKKLEEDRINYIAKRELEAKRKNNGILSAEDATKIRQNAATKFKVDLDNLEKLAALQAEKDAARQLKEDLNDNLKKLREAETFEERKQALKNLTQDEDGNFDAGKAISAAVKAISDLAKQLEQKIDEIASYKGIVDTRLQGSSNEKWAGSYWDQLVHDMTKVGAITPYFKQEAFAANIRDLVNRGISFDLKQRAFLMTIQEKIATTFEVADGTLLRLIRIQQEDSTAGRLGMESALNSFLNNMYETSEYLSTVADSVRGSLEEMQSLMQGTEAAEVEYQVQKWLGSLYSVGMSQSAVQGISTALGQIGAGQIEGLTGNSGAGNLLIMAANDAGLSIADILTDGIDASDTNKLLQASVNYLAELAESAKDNNVVQQQLADVFGVKASDLRAATNLVSKGSIGSIYGSSLSYNNMLAQLSNMAGSMASRTSLAEMMTNIWDNAQYSLAGSMASNPISYFIYKLATVVDNAAGGIDLPFVSVLGSGVDLNTTVSDLMRVAAVGTGLLGSFGSLVQGLGNSFSGRAMLSQLGIDSGSGLAITPRGDGSNLLGATAGGGSQSTSGSGYMGNASSSDIKNSTLQEAADTKKQLMVEAKEEEEANQVDAINVSVVKIYELLNDVAKGNNSLSVRVEGYGLTKAGGSGAGSGAQGGVAALNSANGGSYSSGSSGNGINSSSVSGNVDLGGWIMV